MSGPGPKGWTRNIDRRIERRRIKAGGNDAGLNVRHGYSRSITVGVADEDDID